MTIRRRNAIPDLSERANRELIGLQDEITEELRQLRVEAIGVTTDTKQSGNYACRFNERVRCLPVAAGMTLTFPAAGPGTQNRWIEVLKLGGGNIVVRGTSGNVQGATSHTLTAAGFYYYQSDGATGWWIQPSGGGGGVADGTYGSIVVSGGGLTWRIADGVYGDVTVSGGGLTWTVAAGVTAAQVKLIASMRA